MISIRKISKLIQINVKYILSNFIYIIFALFLFGSFVTSRLLYPNATDDQAVIKNLYVLTFQFSFVYFVNFMCLLYSFLLRFDDVKQGKNKLLLSLGYKTFEYMCANILSVFIITSFILMIILMLFVPYLNFTAYSILVLLLFSFVFILLGFLISLVSQKFTLAFLTLVGILFITFMVPVIFIGNETIINNFIYVPLINITGFVNSVFYGIFIDHRFLFLSSMLLIIILSFSIYFVLERKRKNYKYLSIKDAIIDTLNFER